MLNSIIDFLNITIWKVNGISDMRMFHLLVMTVCAYCIWNEIREYMKERANENKMG